MRRFGIAFATIATFLIGLSTLPRESLVVIAAISALGALGFAVVTSRAAQERVGIARPPAMKYRKLYDDLNVLYDAIGACVNQRGPCKPRSEWQPKVVAWDRRFWAFIDDVFYARGPSIRTDGYKIQNLVELQPREGERHAGRVLAPDEHWAHAALGYIDNRMGALDNLLDDLPK